MKYDYLVVGAGLAGCVTAERIASQLNKKVLIIDRRNHIAGNCYDYKDESGILIHKYGPHAFHTSDERVWDYLSEFTSWINYEHKVLAQIKDKRVPLPINFNSIDLIYPKDIALKIQEKLVSYFGFGNKIPILKLLEVKDDLLNEFAEFVYNNVFLGYTTKQWGLSPLELDPSVTSRIPVSISRDDRYFQDKWQAVPADGYTEMIKNMITHKNIDISLETDFNSIRNNIEYNKLIYTGSIDEAFDCVLGRLPYRSLTFDFETIDHEYFQEVAQVNYPNNFDFTRITEFKHFNGFKSPNSIVAYEYPKQFISSKNEPYYPIPTPENAELYSKYLKLTGQMKNNLIFLGRLGEYKYYNMDQIVVQALKTFEEQIAEQ